MALYNKAYSIAECVNILYPDGNVPRDLQEACELETLYEVTKKSAQLKVYFQQAFDTMCGKEWTVDKIDKAIADIEKCQDKIKRYKSGKFDLSIMADKEYIKKLLKECLCYGVIGGLIGLVMGPQGIPLAGLVGAIGGSQMTKDASGRVFPKIINDIEEENKKALKWLKEERKRVASGKAEKKSLGKIITGKQESTIFRSIEII